MADNKAAMKVDDSVGQQSLVPSAVVRRNFATLHLGEHIDATKMAVDMNVPTAAKDLLLSRAE